MALLLVYGAMASCGGETKPDAAANSKTNTDTLVQATPSFVDSFGAEGTASTALDIYGTYKGITPCADCEGIAVTLVLDSGRHYTLSTTFLGKSDTSAAQTAGNWKWVTGNIIELGGISSAPNRYFVSENKVFQLDIQGNRITGALADRYLLQKQ
jgi:uncharacterized lipoprotein NlpE involved in copper resistance